MEEEAYEPLYWLEILKKAGIVSAEITNPKSGIYTLDLLIGMVIHLGPPSPRESSEEGISSTSTPIFLKALLVWIFLL